jgi:RNA polymerase sigma factor (TIGR02999 family)
MSAPITQIHRMYEHDPAELSRLIPLVYDTLRAMARNQMNREAHRTLPPTALVHEVYLRLMGRDASWQNRRHFFGAAAEAMRRILIEQARRRGRIKNGGDLERLPIDVERLAMRGESSQLIHLSAAMDRLEAADRRKAMVVKLRYFLGFTISEVAEILDVSPATAKLDWSYARAWLHRELFGSDGRGTDAPDHARAAR